MRRPLILAAILIIVCVGSLLFYIDSINQMIDDRIGQLHNSRASVFYALYPPLHKGQRFRNKELQFFLEDQGYEKSKTPDDILPGEFTWEKSAEGTSQLTLYRNSFSGAGHQLDKLKVRVIFDTAGGYLTIQDIVRTDKNESLPTLESIPKQLAAFLAGRVRTQKPVALSDIPVSVRYGVMAIEDSKFLEHHGVSLRGTARALLNNLIARRWVQGGSTITQQLMKNLFFTNKKVISRKFKEALFAFVTEYRHSKEDILEAYLNEVYLGQWGTHEVHGVAEGARYYFNRPVDEISLAQSATLAAIIQAPNAHDPYRHPDRLIKRRNLVLKKMLDLEFILPQEYETATSEGLNVVPAQLNLADLDYFLDLEMDRLPDNIKRRLDSEVFTVYATLNPYLQSLASRVLSDNIERLQKSSPSLRAKAKRGLELQGALISLDLKDCTVLALQGGRSYRQTQFNRVLSGKRQPGSLFKPFVYLTAFAQTNLEPKITPLTLLDDSPLEWAYENQVWKPKNYDNKFRGEVTVRQALENSLNVPTARLAQKVTISPIIETLRKAGIQSPLPNVPSLSLGSADVTPFELAEAYTTLANLGKGCALRPYTQIYDENNNLTFDNPRTQEDRLPAVPSFQTINVMKGVFQHGSARWALSTGLPFEHYAGKTGTTNEGKDAWFVGFSADALTLVWIGYDEEEKLGLSGSAAALPVWLDYTKGAGAFLPEEDFVAPDGLTKVEIDEQSRAVATSKCPEKTLEYFLPGTEPTESCPLHPVP